MLTLAAQTLKMAARTVALKTVVRLHRTLFKFATSPANINAKTRQLLEAATLKFATRVWDLRTAIQLDAAQMMFEALPLSSKAKLLFTRSMLNFTTRDITIGEVLDVLLELLTASFKMSAQSISNTLVQTLTRAALKFSPASIRTFTSMVLDATIFKLAPNAIQPTLLLMFERAGIKFTATDIGMNAKTMVALTRAAFKLTARAINPVTLLQYAATTFKFSATQITTSLKVNLGRAQIRFLTRAIDILEGGGSIAQPIVDRLKLIRNRRILEQRKY